MQLVSTTAALVALSLGSVMAQDDAPAVDPEQTRELIRQWVKTERLISEEKTAWQVEKKRMQELLSLYQKELGLLNEELEKAGASAHLIDKDKERLEEELERYRAAQRALADTMTRLLPRIQALIARFPKPLKDELSADIDALNTLDASTQARDVLRSTIALLSAAGRFNRTLTLVEETRTVSGGRKISVNVLYLGMARAFYTARSGDVAGIGTPGKDGWEWSSQGEIADDVRQAIAVYRKDQQPQLLKLPVALDKEKAK